MPQIVTDEQGTVHEFPDAATPEMIGRALNLTPSNAPDHASMNAKTQRDLNLIQAGMDPDVKVPDATRRAFAGFTRGVVDPSRAIAQGISQVVDSPADQARFNQNFNADEQRYQRGRTALGGEGIDLGRFGGNVGATLPLAMALPATGTVLGSAAAGAAAGAAGNALQPVYGLPDSGEGFGGAKLKQAREGAVSGALTGGALSALGKVVGGVATPEAGALRGEGVNPTLGQTAGGMAGRIEEGLTSLPLVGDKIKGAQLRSLESYNTAALNKTLAPIGETISESTPVGHAAVKEAGQKISAAYNDVLTGLSAPVDQAFGQDIQAAFRTASMLPKDRAEQFRKIVAEQLARRIDPTTGALNEDAIKTAISELGKHASNYINTNDADQRLLGGALAMAKDAVSDLVKRANPVAAERLSNIDTAYAMQLRLENAAGKAGTAARSGVFTPAQLDAAVRQMDNSLRGRAYARGDALLQDFAERGIKALGSTVPDSGTPFRLGVISNLLTNANPAYWALAKAGSLPWTPTGQAITTGLMAARPPGAQAIGGLLQQAAPAIAAGGARLPPIAGLLGP